MKDDVKSTVCKNTGQLVLLQYIHFIKYGLVMDVFPAAGTQVVYYDDMMAGFDETVNQMRANKSGSACY